MLSDPPTELPILIPEAVREEALQGALRWLPKPGSLAKSSSTPALPRGWQRFLLGLSRQGRPIEGWAYQWQPTQSLTHLIKACIHGDEPLSACVAWRYLHHLMGVSPEALSVKTSLLCIPVLNPDGVVASTRKNGAGVDLNRNFATCNWQPLPSTDPYFGGFYARSEPETQLLEALLESSRPERILSLHTPYRLLNFDGPCAPLAEAMGQAMDYPVEASIGYPTPGSFGTYAGVERDLSVLTLELPPDDALAPEQVFETVLPGLHLFLSNSD
jgi:murein peptide amidase A